MYLSFEIQCVFVFISMLIADICWAYYIRRVKDGKPLAASFWAVLLFLTGVVAIIEYVKDSWFLVPASFGAFCGTYVAVYLDHKKHG